MSGIEPVAPLAGKIVAGAAKQVIKGNDKEKELILNVAREEGYLDNAAKSLAKRITVKQTVLLKFWGPLGRWAGISADYFKNDFVEDMADRMQDVPDENIIEPPPNVAAAALEGLAVSLDEPDLKEMYLNLLAASSDNRRSGTAHPAFADIIRQLTSQEANDLRVVLSEEGHPLIRVELSGGPGSKTGSSNIVQNNVADWRLGPVQTFDLDRPVQIENWARLGLIEVSYSTHFTIDSAYEWAENHPIMVAFRNRPDEKERNVRFTKGIMRVTAFGKRFYAAVIDDDSKEPREIDTTSFNGIPVVNLKPQNTTAQ